ncbi:MAG TPA: Abi family protein [Candidatus Cybelea sp.]|nr:Abi family protein [Candidatus Cybelea sp.]
MSKFFAADDAGLRAEILRLFGPDRLAGYFTDARGLADRALQIYVWNAALGGAFLPAIGAVEVSLRNALSDQLSNAFTAPWYDDSSFIAIDRNALATGIVRAKRHITAKGKPVTPSRMVAQLTFGFWVMLLRPSYARSLWPILRPAFAAHTRRSRATDAFDPLVGFRNRLAHHHLLYDRDPHIMYERLMAGARLLSPELAEWIEHHSRIRQLLSGGPIQPALLF